MNYELLQYIIIVFDFVVLFLVSAHLLTSKKTWAHALVRFAVLCVAAGFAAQIVYSIEILRIDRVNDVFPIWMLKDLGMGALLLMDMFKPSVYWTEEAEGEQ